MAEILRLFLCFLEIGFFSIGGGYATIPLIQEKAVLQQQYLTMEQFSDIITFSQMTPGPLAVNLSTFTGFQIGGLTSAFAATLGCVISGILISFLLYRFFQKHHHNHLIQMILDCLKAASVGLILSSFLTILTFTLFPNTSIHFSSLDLVMLTLFLVCCLLIRRFHFSMPVILGLCACAGFLRFMFC